MLKIFGLTSILFITGCSFLTPPSQLPVIEAKLNRGLVDDSSEVGTLSVTPERRVVLAKFSTKDSKGNLVSSARYCAEAPTEVGVNVDSLIKAGAEIKGESELGNALEYISAISLGNSVLNKRSQGLQLFQNSSFFLCQMYMNESINENQLIAFQLQTLRVAAVLIEKEIPLLHGENDQVLNSSIEKLKLEDSLNLILKLKSSKKTPLNDENPVAK